MNIHWIIDIVFFLFKKTLFCCQIGHTDFALPLLIRNKYTLYKFYYCSVKTIGMNFSFLAWKCCLPTKCLQIAQRPKLNIDNTLPNLQFKMPKPVQFTGEHFEQCQLRITVKIWVILNTGCYKLFLMNYRASVGVFIREKQQFRLHQTFVSQRYTNVLWHKHY